MTTSRPSGARWRTCSASSVSPASTAGRWVRCRPITGRRCFPDAVARIVVNCGVARTAVHNQVFLRSLMATLEAAPQHIGNGRFSAEPRAAKRAFGRIYAAWALSQDFYRAGLHLAADPTPNLGAPDLETFLKTDWEDRFGAAPPPTCMRNCAPGTRPISAPMTCITATSAPPCAPSRRGSC